MSRRNDPEDPIPTLTRPPPVPDLGGGLGQDLVVGDARIVLRDYQEEAVTASEAARARGVRRQLLVLPTGTGKAIVFVEVLRRRGGRALILVHRDELISQALDKLALTGITEVGVVKAARDEHARRVVAASIQTLARPDRLARIPTDITTVVVDEAHHVVAETYRRVLDHLRATADHGPLLLGVTATVERGDGLGLDRVFEEVVYEKPILEMIQRGYLADLRAIEVKLSADFGALHVRAGDFVDREVEDLLRAADAPTHIAQAWQQHAAGRPTLVFTPTIAVAHEVARAFTDAGIAAAALCGETPLEERRRILERFHRGELRVVTNCAVLTEGFDEPSIGCIVIARPTRSKTLYVQCIGRGTRPHPAKVDCLILDVVGATRRHDLVTTASLFGVAPGGAVESSLLDAVAEVREREGARVTAARGTLVSQVVDLFRTTPRPAAWVTVDASRYVLALGDAGQLHLVSNGEGWRVIHRPRQGGGDKLLARGPSLEYMHGAAMDFTRRLGPRIRALIDPRALWRQDPASPGQFELGRKWRVTIPPTASKGEAADLLTAAIARATGPR
jgi:ATP-dependent helicase IRC3